MKLLNLVNKYITYKRSLGLKFDTNLVILKAFSKYIGVNKMVSNISDKKIADFLYKGTGTVTNNFFTKLTVLRGFYNYSVTRSYVKRSPIPTNLPQKPKAFTPYIYSHKELKRLFAAALTYQKIHSFINPYMIHVLLVLLYGTGMRLSEALSLKISDINFSESFLTIHETKFYKTRLVPFGKKVAVLLAEYMKWKRKNEYFENDDHPVFMGRKNEFLSGATVRSIFDSIRQEANIKRTDNNRFQPRIHDLRHAFAVHRLTSWYKKHNDVQKLLPSLSIYLGHVCLESTAVYLTMTPELLTEANMRFEQYVNGGAQ